MNFRKHWVRAPAPSAYRRPVRVADASREPAGVLRALLLGAVVFVAAVLIAGLLAGAAPAGPVSPAQTSASGQEESVVSVSAEAPAAAHADLGFAHSMIFSGVAALVLSLIGTVMVARRRRLW